MTDNQKLPQLLDTSQVEALESMDLSFDSIADQQEKIYADRLNALNKDALKERLDECLKEDYTSFTISLSGYIPHNHPTFLAIKAALLRHDLIEKVHLINDYDDLTQTPFHDVGPDSFKLIQSIIIELNTPLAIAKRVKQLQKLALTKQTWWGRIKTWRTPITDADIKFLEEQTGQTPAALIENNTDRTAQRYTQMKDNFTDAAKRIETAAQNLMPAGLDVDLSELNQTIHDAHAVLDLPSTDFVDPPLRLIRARLSSLADNFETATRRVGITEDEITGLAAEFTETLHFIDDKLQAAQGPLRRAVEVGTDVQRDQVRPAPKRT